MTARPRLKVVTHDNQEHMHPQPTLRPHRVTVKCVRCGRDFRYQYSGRGAFRATCPQCKGDK